jgi:hypothetical protein
MVVERLSAESDYRSALGDRAQTRLPAKDAEPVANSIEKLPRLGLPDVQIP